MPGQRIGIVGGGIVGLAVGRELTRRWPGVEVTVYEKENRLAAHQTGHNSGVVHAGLYYRAGSLKAELCTRGRLLLRDYCAEHGLPYRECGKLVVAVDAAELARLDRLEQTAAANRVPGLRRLGSAAIAEIEPHAAGLSGLHSPATAITDYPAIAGRYGAEITSAGGTIRLSTAVAGVARVPGGIAVRTGESAERMDAVVVAAGLQADVLSRPVDGDADPRIVPLRGEYLAVQAAKRDLIRGMVYPVPDPRYPFLGVHFTRRVGGELEVGPNAVLALSREGYRWGRVDAGDLAGLATWPGFWRLARAHWRTGWEELGGSLSLRTYMRRASRYVPEIGAADVVRAGAGVRAQAVDRDGSLVDDFRVTGANGVTCIRNAPSPAATASLAIAEYVVDRMF